MSQRLNVGKIYVHVDSNKVNDGVMCSKRTYYIVLYLQISRHYEKIIGFVLMPLWIATSLIFDQA